VKDSRAYLAQILDCIARVESYVVDGEEAFFSSSLIQDAVVRNLEIIGEAAGRVPEDYRRGTPEIPWRELIGFRNVLIHQSVVGDHPEGIDAGLVWEAVVTDLPRIKSSVAKLIPSTGGLEDKLSK
jgi:uncharacterized protein with HEPN domain